MVCLFGRLSTKPARRVGERPSNFGFDQQGPEAPLPTRFAITPYFEEALKDREPSSLPLLVLLQQLDLMLNKEP
ncbi:hypothetical protein AN660_0217640 [Serratia marcescens]|nr:hypothetical protein AN660_0217640 [Serratia marcescens]